jgi:hypothetical protein
MDSMGSVTVSVLLILFPPPRSYRPLKYVLRVTLSIRYYRRLRKKLLFLLPSAVLWAVKTIAQ